MSQRSMILGWFASLMLMVVAGCAKGTATTPPPTPPQPNAATTTPAAANDAEPDLTEPENDDPFGDSAGVASGSTDGDGPLQFEMTEEEKAKQLIDQANRSADNGSLTDAVPKPLKSGAFGSLGGALYRGLLGGGSAESTGNDGPAGDAPSGEVPGVAPSGDAPSGDGDPESP